MLPSKVRNYFTWTKKYPFTLQCKICKWEPHVRPKRFSHTMHSHLRSTHFGVFLDIMKYREGSVEDDITGSEKFDKVVDYTIESNNLIQHDDDSGPENQDYHRIGISFRPFPITGFPIEFFEEIGLEPKVDLSNKQISSSSCSEIIVASSDQVSNQSTENVSEQGIYTGSQCIACQRPVNDDYASHIAWDCLATADFEEHCFTCPACSRSFTNHFLLDVHLNSPSHILKFGEINNIHPPCSVCFEKFSNRNLRNDHMRSTRHEPELDYLNRKDRGKLPVSVHPFWVEARTKKCLPSIAKPTFSRKFPCPSCPRVFNSHFKIEAHVRSTTHIKQFGVINIYPPCSVCSEEFMGGIERNQHLISTGHEPEVDYLNKIRKEDKNKVPVSFLPFWVKLRQEKHIFNDLYSDESEKEDSVENSDSSANVNDDVFNFVLFNNFDSNNEQLKRMRSDNERRGYNAEQKFRSSLRKTPLYRSNYFKGFPDFYKETRMSRDKFWKPRGQRYVPHKRKHSTRRRRN